MRAGARGLPHMRLSFWMNTDSLPWAFGEPGVCGWLCRLPEDFQVDEIPGFEPDGTGQHALLRIRKRNCNTEWLARQIARIAGVHVAQVSYAGQKDRYAVTTQWFSVDLAGQQEPDWTLLETPDIRVLEVTRHRRKVRRGALQGNRFVLRIRDIVGDRQALEARFQQIRNNGVPNYFGRQRFGHDNLRHARDMFAGQRVPDRYRRGIYLSAVRAMLFNEVLSRRVMAGTWDRPLAGDAMLLDGTNSFFMVSRIDDDMVERSARQDVHPTGPLWGRGKTVTGFTVRELERQVMDDHRDWCDGLERFACEQQRRALRVRVIDLEWEFTRSAILELYFQLPPGSYATTVTKELINVKTNVRNELPVALGATGNPC